MFPTRTVVPGAPTSAGFALIGDAGADELLAGAVTVDDEDEVFAAVVDGVVATGPLAFDVLSATAELAVSAAAEAPLDDELLSEQPVKINGRLAPSTIAQRAMNRQMLEPRSPCEGMNDDAQIAFALRSLAHVACWGLIIGRSSLGLE